MTAAGAVPQPGPGLLFAMHVYADGRVDVFDRDGRPRPDVDLAGILRLMAATVHPEEEEEEEEEAPRHYSRDELLPRLLRGEAFTLELQDGETAWDPETGDSLIGPSTWVYRAGTFPGPGFICTRVDRA